MGRHRVQAVDLRVGGAHRPRDRRQGSGAHDAAFDALVGERDMLVQPFLPEIVSDGEWSLLFFGGEYSHAVRKRTGDRRLPGAT